MTHFKDCPHNVSNWIFPHKCGVCGKFDMDFLCVKCYNLLKSKEKFTVDKYDSNLNFFSEHLYFFKYEDVVRRLILDYKFNDLSFLYKTFVKFFIKNENLFKFLKSYDTIIPVPISKNRFKERGFNQSELLAKELIRQYKKSIVNKYNFKNGNIEKNFGMKINLELSNNNLIKVNNIIEQSKLNKKEREQNIKGAYKILDKSKLENKSILLIDDVYTTGSTARECCKVIKKANPKKIGVMTIAKD